MCQSPLIQENTHQVFPLESCSLNISIQLASTGKLRGSFLIDSLHTFDLGFSMNENLCWPL